MSQILEKLRCVDPNDSDAVKEIITAFFQNLPKHTEINSNVWLRVLENVITRFPRYCAQHRSTIENYLIHFLDSPNYYIAIDVAKCAHGLQQIRPSQDKAATAKNCWREQMSILCHAAHKIIEALFSKTVDLYKASNNIKKLETNLLSNTKLTIAFSHVLNVKKGQNGNALDKNIVLCNKLRNIFVFIQAMLVEIYPVAKPVQPQLILEVIVQALSLSSSVSTNAAEAATIKIQALRTLDAMISCLGANLIPFSPLVFRCVMQSLRWSSDNPHEESKKVRCAAYGTLAKWLSTLHAQRAGQGKGRAWDDELTDHVLADVTPVRKVVQLTMSNQFTKNLSKKARKKLANTMLEQSTISSHMPGEKSKTAESEDNSDEVAMAALECAETFLTVCGIFLKPATHKIFQERLVRECFNLDSYTTDRSILLLRTLDACRKNTPPNVPPPTQYLLQLYSTLVNSQSDEIRKFSSQALLDIRLHLHCSPPSLTFAMEPLPENKKPEDKRKRISEKNRAALESLLGKERMPETEEVITIPDEPSSKRPRLESEVIADNISVSSDSRHSIEISDDDANDDIILEIAQDENQEQTQDDTTEPDVGTPKNDEGNTDAVDSAADPTADVTSPVQDDKPNELELTEETNIYEAKTQIPLNTSTDTIERDNSPVSMEIVYDPNAEQKVAVLEKTEDDNLPSTNDTDDVQITCGQTIQSSQEVEPEKSVQIEEIPLPEANDSKEAEKIDENEDVSDKNEVIENIEVKITTKEITVDDMLADFVDEVNEENKTEV